jgi:hypothetical protein
MKNVYIEHIKSTLEMRLQFNYGINLNNLQCRQLLENISNFSDEDYEKGNKKLIYTIKDTLILFGIFPSIASNESDRLFK